MLIAAICGRRNMEITEKWIGQSAGGKVFREARALVRLGKVQKLERKEVERALIYQAMVGTGKRPIRVVVKVLSLTHVQNQCSCMMSRKTGAMCEHAAAVLLASTVEAAVETAKVKAVEVAKKIPELVAFDVRLSPQFPQAGVRAVHLKKAGEVEVCDADRALGAWLLQNVGRLDAMMLSLPEDKVDSFYKSLAGHPRVSAGGESLSIQVGALRPRIDLEVEGESMWIKLADGQESLVALGGSLACWEDSGFILSQKSVKMSGLLTLDELLSGDWFEVDLGKFVRALSSLEHAFLFPEGLGGLDIREGDPVVELEIAGSTRALQARLTMEYTPDARIPLSVTGETSVPFPVPSSEPHQWYVRNNEVEQSAMAEILNAGFQMLDASGMMFLRGEDEVLDFLTTKLPQLREKWRVKTEEKLVNVESRLKRIVPHITEQGSGTDWLSCEVTWQCDGKVLDPKAVQRLLQSGTRSLPMARGGKAVISKFDANVMEGFLLDTNPRQEGGRYLFSSQQAAYVRRLRAHYGEVKEGEDIAVPALPDDLENILREYQKEGVQWLYRRAKGEGGALLADDMGLGKTLQTLAFLQLWKREHREPALIVCPATLLGNWRDEAEKFTPGLTVLVMHGAGRKKYYDVMESADLIITSYALLGRDQKYYEKMNLAAVVLDEASAIKNPDILVAKSVRKVEAAVRIAITGTPVENSVRDLWSIFQFLLPGYLGSREDFRRRYEIPCAAMVPDQAAMQRLRLRTAPFMLRRTKSLVAKDLPPKLESVVWCDPSSLQKEHYQAILRHGVEKVDALRQQAGADGARMQMLTVLLRLRQSCCDLRLLDAELDAPLAELSSKLSRLMELLEEAQRGGHRVLVFSQFTAMLGWIRNALDDQGVDFCYLDGGTKNRSEEVKKFQSPTGPPVFLISLKAGGYGLTLTAADTVVLFDPWWNPAVEAQAADRIHRIGQTKPSTIYKLITRGTVEEKILRLQEKKRGVISAAMGEAGDEAAPMMHGLSESEMLDLLEM